MSRGARLQVFGGRREMKGAGVEEGRDCVVPGSETVDRLMGRSSMLGCLTSSLIRDSTDEQRTGVG